jgi:parallel beta-helix repeat protein
MGGSDKGTRTMVLMARLFVVACLGASCASDGKDGTDGTNGTNGTNGTDGTNGTNGANGTDGCTTVVSTVAALRQALAEVGEAGGGTVCLSAGQYELQDFLSIVHDRIVLRGEGPATHLKLPAAARTPAIVIGDAETAEPEKTRIPRVKNVVVERLSIDGGWDGQSPQASEDELHVRLRHLRNNGITVRYGEMIELRDIVVAHARSGGITIEKESRFIGIENVASTANYFDGISLNRTALSRIVNSVFQGNRLAGLTSEHLTSSLVHGNMLVQNGSFGFYMSDSYDNQIEANQFVGNTNAGVYLTCASLDAAGTCYPASLSKHNNFSDNYFVCNERGYNVNSKAEANCATDAVAPNYSHFDVFHCNDANNRENDQSAIGPGQCLGYSDVKTVVPCDVTCP